MDARITRTTYLGEKYYKAQYGLDKNCYQLFEKKEQAKHFLSLVDKGIEPYLAAEYTDMLFSNMVQCDKTRNWSI